MADLSSYSDEELEERLRLLEERLEILWDSLIFQLCEIRAATLALEGEGIVEPGELEEMRVGKNGG